MKKAIGVVIWSVLSLLVLAAAVLSTITWWLTPSRLSSILSHEMSEYFNADIRIDNVRFTFWSTFPRITLETDSIAIISHSLDSLPGDQLEALPGNPRLLATASALKGGVNIPELLKNRFVMHDLDVSSLHLNLVSINDSVNNYDIMPRRRDLMDSIPFFTTNILTLHSPKGIDLYFAKSDTRGRIDLDSAVMRRTKGTTEYDLALKGRITASASDLKVFDNFPFYLQGGLDLGFKPFRLKFEDFAINLESLRSRLDMTLDIEGKMEISSLSYSISMVNIVKLLKSMPWMPMENLGNLDTDLEVRLTATLDRPYSFSSGGLPWVTVTAEIAGNQIDYRTPDGQYIPLSYSKIVAGLVFDGSMPSNSSLFLHPVVLRSGESEVTVSASARNLLGSPFVSLEFEGESSLEHLADRFPKLSGFGIGGDLLFSGEMTGNLLSMSPQDIQKGLRDVRVVSKVEVDGLHFGIDGYNFTASRVEIKGKSRGRAIDTGHLLDGTIDLEATASGARLISPSGTIAYSAEMVAATSAINGLIMRKGKDILPLSMDVGNFTLEFSPGNSVTLNDASITYGRLPGKEPESNPFDLSSSYFACRAPSGCLQTSFLTPTGKKTYVNQLVDIDAYYSADSLSVRNIGIRSMDTYARVSGEAVGLDSYIRSGLKDPLGIRLDVDCDTIDINQLAHIYYHGSREMQHKPRKDCGDTATLLIPRNIDAILRFSAQESLYTDMRLSQLGGMVKVKNGKASVEDFSLMTDFGKIAFDAIYDTSDIQHMTLGFDADIDNIDISALFGNFRALLRIVPEIENLRGKASLDLDAGMLLFPSMYVDVPSLHADINIKGWDLTLHQDSFIRRLARKLMIRSNNDLEIADINIRARIRDNLLELFPFDFRLENYLLSAVGTSNFEGDMYYHIDVKKSPVPFSFGVNIQGTAGDPKIRLGRGKYDARKGEEITLRNESDMEMNIVTEAKYYAREFLRKAALAGEHE